MMHVGGIVGCCVSSGMIVVWSVAISWTIFVSTPVTVASAITIPWAVVVIISINPDVLPIILAEGVIIATSKTPDSRHSQSRQQNHSNSDSCFDHDCSLQFVRAG
jgi:hypothetical protein